MVFTITSDPLARAETAIEERGWKFDNIADGQIGSAAPGRKGIYPFTIAVPTTDNFLRMLFVFDLKVPEEHVAVIREVERHANDCYWSSHFVHWPSMEQMTWRCGIATDEAVGVSPEIINQMIDCGISQCDRYYLPFQVAAAGGSMEDAIEALDAPIDTDTTP